MPAEFRPFPAVRFADPALSKGLCPPYDVIGTELAARLRRLPLNAIHVELPKDKDYSASARTWRRWLERGELAADPAPAFYLCEQSFSYGGRPRRRLGVFGALGLTEPGRSVLAHERTFPKPRQDRMRLLTALKANTSPVFGVFKDPRGTLAGLRRGKALSSGRAPDGSRYRLWAIKEPRSLSAVSRAVAESGVLIADGHHRYQVALEFSRRSKLPGAGRVLAYLVPDEDAGLVVLPTHRVVQAEDVPLDLVNRACTVRQFKGLRALERGLKGLSFGLVLPAARGALYLLCSPRPDFSSVGGRPALLDVQWVQGRLLDGAEGVQYVHLAAEADRIVRDSRGEKAAVILGPLSVPAIRKAVLKTGLLPQKSTYFHPKIATGLVFRSLEA